MVDFGTTFCMLDFNGSTYLYLRLLLGTGRSGVGLDRESFLISILGLSDPVTDVAGAVFVLFLPNIMF